MAASKLRLRISACILDCNEIPTAIPMFSGSNYQIRIMVMLYTVELEETGSGKFKMAASKLRLLICQRVHKIATKFQWLCLCVCNQTIKIG